MLRRLIIAIAVASALGISFCPTDALARRTRAAVADSVPSWDLTASCRAAGSVAFSQTPFPPIKETAHDNTEISQPPSRLFTKRSTNALRRGDNRAPNFRVELRALEPAYGLVCRRLISAIGE
jgi:hypothetical protein